MGLTTLFEKGIYESIHPFKRSNDDIAPGQLIWCPVPHLNEVPLVLEAARANPTSHTSVNFKIRRVKTSDFRSKPGVLPVAGLNLGPTEEYLVSKAKERLCVVLFRNNTKTTDPKVLEKIKSKKHLYSDDLIVAPLFGLQSGTHVSGFPVEMVTRIRHFMYKQFVYLPAFRPKHTEVDDADIYEAILRFDRILVSSDHYLAARKIDVKMKDDVFKYLLHCLKDFLDFETNADYLALKGLLAESFETRETKG